MVANAISVNITMDVVGKIEFIKYKIIILKRKTVLFNNPQSKAVLKFGALLLVLLIEINANALEYSEASSTEVSNNIPTLRELAEGGNPQAQYELAETYYKWSKEAFDWYQKSANQGYPPAQAKIGYIYRYGHITQSVDTDYFKSVEWSKKAALQGDADAQYSLGWLYRHGAGVRIDKEEAREWFGRACDNGNQSGCNAYKELNK